MKTVEELVSDIPWWVDYDEFADEWRVYCHRDHFPDGCVSLDGVYNKGTALFLAASPLIYKAAYDLVRAFDSRTLTVDHVDKLREALESASEIKEAK